MGVKRGVGSCEREAGLGGFDGRARFECEKNRRKVGASARQVVADSRLAGRARRADEGERDDPEFGEGSGEVRRLLAEG